MKWACVAEYSPAFWPVPPKRSTVFHQFVSHCVCLQFDAGQFLLLCAPVCVCVCASVTAACRARNPGHEGGESGPETINHELDSWVMSHGAQSRREPLTRLICICSSIATNSFSGCLCSTSGIKTNRQSETQLLPACAFSPSESLPRRNLSVFSLAACRGRVRVHACACGSAFGSSCSTG